jgi:CRISPR-associated protein Csb2
MQHREWTRPVSSKGRACANHSGRFARRPAFGGYVPIKPAVYTLARFLLDAPVLPLVTDTVRVAEAFRRAVMGRFRSWCERHPERAERFRRADEPARFCSQVFAGKDAAGAPLHDCGHAHYVPTVEGADPRRLTHVTLWAPAGFGPEEVAALGRLHDVRCGELDLRVQLIGLGQPADFRAPLLGPSRTWTSATPFVAHRHLKRRGQKKDTPRLQGDDPRAAFLELAARELIERRDIGPLASVAAVAPRTDQPRPFEFHRNRERDGGEGSRRAFGYLKLRFTEPIQGPLCLGYASHFGLGLFLPNTNALL